MFKSNCKQQPNSNVKNIISEYINIQGILTPRICAELVVEIIKLLSHQKLQIPYKYEVLKCVVEKRKELDGGTEGAKQESSWQSQKYFHTISTALNVLDNIFKNITSEMDSSESPDEIYIIFGSSPTMPKEVFRILLPDNLHDHYHQNHSANLKNIVFDTMRKIIASSNLSKTICHPIQPTNMYVAFNRKPKMSKEMLGERRAFSEFFYPIQQLKISPKVTQTIINLKYTTPSDVNCCNKMVIFEDFAVKCNVSDGQLDEKNCIKTDLQLTNNLENANKLGDTNQIQTHCSLFSDLSKSNCVNLDVFMCNEEVKSDCVNLSNEEINWFQSSMVLKGFKDCCINGKSISISWLNS